MCLFACFCNVGTEILRLFDCGKIHATFSVVFPDKSLAGALIEYYKHIPRTDCLANCILHINCQSTNFILEDGVSDAGYCELNRKNISGNICLLVERKGCLYAETPTNESQV